MMTENDNDDDQDQEQCQEPINIPFDRRTMTVNLSGIPVTDFQYNTRVMPPKVGSGDQELSIQLMKSEVLRASSMFCKSKCDESGTLKNMTLSRSEVRGRTKLLMSVKDSDKVLSSTDKSGKIAVWSRDLYIEAAQKHITKDDLVNQELVNKFENQANGLATATCNAFNLGSEREQQDRVSKAMKVFDVPPPNVFFLAKDHKDIPIIPSGRIYPKTRGVCGAKTGPISRLQNLYSLALGFSADALKAPTECNSSEIMKRGIMDTNRNMKDNPQSNLETIILSLDVCALYPSITIDLATKSIFKMVLKSKIKFSNVDYKEVGKILRVFCSDQDLKDHKI